MVDEARGADAALDVLSQFFIKDGTVGTALLRMSELACEFAPADMAGITMMVEGQPRTGVFTDPEAPEIDTGQYDIGEGPCLSAFRDGKVYTILDCTKEERWPRFARKAAAHGISSTLSLPLVARGESLGALNLYSRRLSAFDGGTVERVGMFSRQASIVLANVQVYWDARELNENLQQALHSRATIDQAIGIVMARQAMSPEGAFQVLVRASQRENRRLRDIAVQIVEDAARHRNAPDAPPSTWRPG